MAAALVLDVGATPLRPPADGGPAGLPGHSCALGSFGPGRWPDSCWRPYGPTSPFNQRLAPDAPLHPRSAEIVRRTTDFGAPHPLVAGVADTADDWNRPTYYSQPTDPVVEVRCLEPWGTCPIEGHMIRMPAEARPAGGGDGHLTVVDQQGGYEYGLWQVREPSRERGVLEIGWGGRTPTGGDGLGSAGTAAGFGGLAGLVRAPELIAGRIDHALFMTVRCDSGSYVHPATQSGRPCREVGLSERDAPPMGARYRLDMTPEEIALLRAPVWAKTLLRAMATYGMFVGDTGGGTWGIKAESGTTYTAFGYEDPLVGYARAQGVPVWEGHHLFELDSLVDWRARLRVVDPCVTAGTC